jgi:hypothetical protein
VKRFITSAEHDMSDNIIHLVLARPEGAGPGTKGLSLFVVPKYHFDHETGELGERNGAYVTNVENKMGLKVSTTCEVTFGDEASPADRLPRRRRARRHRADVRRHRVRPHDGRHQGHRDPVDRLPERAGLRQERVQGADLTQMMDKTAPRVTIIHHPDVRRSLMLQKSYAEGLRALCCTPRSHQDKVAEARSRRRGRDGRADQRPAAADRQGRRLGARLRDAAPSRCRPRRFRLPAGLPDRAVHPRRQDRHALRGHHGDPGQDFFFRKIIRDQGQAITKVAGQITETVEGTATATSWPPSANCSRRSRTSRA